MAPFILGASRPQKGTARLRFYPEAGCRHSHQTDCLTCPSCEVLSAFGLVEWQIQLTPSAVRCKPCCDGNRVLSSAAQCCCGTLAVDRAQSSELSTGPSDS